MILDEVNKELEANKNLAEARESVRRHKAWGVSPGLVGITTKPAKRVTVNRRAILNRIPVSVARFTGSELERPSLGFTPQALRF